MKRKMNKNKIIFLLVTISVALFFANFVSAADFGVQDVTIDGVSVVSNPSIIAGNTIVVKTYVFANTTSRNVKVSLEMNGEKKYVSVTSSPFDVEKGHTYMKLLKLRVPYELNQELSNSVDLEVKIWGGSSNTLIEVFPLRVQRPSYNAEIMSIETPNEIKAGENIPVDISIKNTGYNDLNDLYVHLTIPNLGIEKNVYFRDLVPLKGYECYNDDVCNSYYKDHLNLDDKKSETRRIYVQLPYDVSPGSYILKVKATNEDMSVGNSKQIFIQNPVPNQVIRKENSLLMINPTNSIKIYKVIMPDGKNTSIVVQAGSTRSFEMNLKGEYDVLSEGKLLGRFFFTPTNETTNKVSNNLVSAITVILVVLLIVLIIILVVLLTKKPKKKEELGESYY